MQKNKKNNINLPQQNPRCPTRPTSTSPRDFQMNLERKKNTLIIFCNIDVISSSLHSRLVYKRERLKGYTILVLARGSMGNVTYKTRKHNLMKYKAIVNQTKQDSSDSCRSDTNFPRRQKANSQRYEMACRF